MKPWRVLKAVSDSVDAFEAGVVLVLGTLLGTALAVGLPGFLAWRLFRDGRAVLGGLVATLLALAVVGVVRDLRARRMSWISAVLLALWTLCVAYVGIRILIA